MEAVLKNVLHVPNPGMNLFSICSATEQGSDVRFVGQEVILSKNGRVNMTGRRAGQGLYIPSMQLLKTKLGL